MKTYRVFGIALVTGTEKELGWVEALAYGDYQLTKMRPEDVRKMEGGGYHVHRNQKGGPRKIKRVADMETTGDSNTFDADAVMETMAGMEDKREPVVFQSQMRRWNKTKGRWAIDGETGRESDFELRPHLQEADYPIHLPGQEAPHVSD